MNLSLKDKEWREFFITDIFDEIQRGKRLKKNDHIKGVVPYASSTSINNGIDGFIGNKSNIRVFDNCLTLANSGSVGVCFFQPFQFIASDHVTKLENKQFNKYIYLFIAQMISRLSEKYSFNREINDVRIKREKIMLPIDKEGKPDYTFMEEYMYKKEKEKNDAYKKFIQTRLSEIKNVSIIPLSEKEWSDFFIEDIARINSGERLTKANMTKGNIPFVGATDSNNGVTGFVSNINSSIDENVLGVNYNGSVVENFYHPYKAVFSDDVKRVSLKNHVGNKYLYLFLKTIILKQKSKYQYGYKFNGQRMARQKIMLPVDTEGNPDYEYMEQYMKNIEYEKLKLIQLENNNALSS